VLTFGDPSKSSSMCFNLSYIFLFFLFYSIVLVCALLLLWKIKINSERPIFILDDNILRSENTCIIDYKDKILIL
jgi:hypothetical protein